MINNYRMAHCHIRSQSDNEQGIKKLRPQRDIYFLYNVALFDSISTLESFVVVVLDRFFSFERHKKVVVGRMRQVFILYINDCMEICFHLGLSNGRPR